MSERGSENCNSSIIRKVKEEALGYFENEEIGIIAIIGFGRWRTAEYIVKAVKDRLFSIVIKIPKSSKGGWDLREIQMIILEQLGLNKSPVHTIADDDDDEHKWDEKKVFKEIYRNLENKNFLLVLEDPPLEGVKYIAAGVPLPHPGLSNARKILITTGSQDLCKVMQTDRDIQLETDNDEEFPELVNEVCLGVADSQRFRGHLTHECIMWCLKCMSLFGKRGVLNADLFYCWLGEGFTGGGNKDLDINSEWKMGQDLLIEFVQRDLITSYKRGNLIYYAINERIQHKGFIQVVSTVYLPSLTGEDDKFHNRKFSWISLANCHFQRMHNSPKCPKASMLLLCDCAQLTILPDDLFNEMKDVRVLDLSGTSISSLPSSLPCLAQNLRVLNLRNCQYLKDFATFIQDLENLDILDLSGTSIVFNHDQQISFQCSPKIQILNLSNNPHLSSLPSSFFSSLTNLQHLDLSSTKSLMEIPSSLSLCINLKHLILRDCSSLRIVVTYLSQLHALQLLDLSGCTSLQDIASFGQFNLPNLQFLDLSRTITQIVQLSLRGYRSLEKIELEGVTNIEVLDLSGTKIKEFPYKFCSEETTTLKRLYLVGTSHLRRVDWEKIKHPPKELLIWDQCDDSYDNLPLESDHHQPPETHGGAFISASSNTTIFGRPPSKDISNFLQKLSGFHVIIPPYSERGGSKGLHHISFQKKQFFYTDIYDKFSSTLSSTTPNTLTPTIHFDHFTGRSKQGGYLEINGGTCLPKHLGAVLCCTRFLFVCNNDFVESLSQFDLTKSGKVEECWIEKCHGMTILFKSEKFPNSYTLSSLQNLWVSNLARLMTLCKGPFPRECFSSLKHICLEYCSSLVNVFSFGLFQAGLLRSLETLEIRFCGRLKQVFEEGTMDYGGEGEGEGEGSMIEGSSSPLPQLHTLYLWELSALENIGGPNIYLPRLKNLRVRGCPKLHELPLDLENIDRKIDIKGESEWWNNLRWRKDQKQRIKNCINFVGWDPFTLQKTTTPPAATTATKQSKKFVIGYQPKLD